MRRAVKCSLLAVFAALLPQAFADAGSALEDDVTKVLSTLEREMPGALEDVHQKDRAKVIAALLEATGCGAKLADNTDNALQVSSPGPSCLPAIMMHSNKILYLRVNRFDKEAVATLLEECATAFRSVRRPSGLALDLRNCRGGSELEAVEIGKALKNLETPVALLVNGRTSGGAEILAALLEHERIALSFGTSTAGKPFSVKKIVCGDYALSLPVVSKNLPYVKQTPLKPSVELEDNPQADYSKLRNELRSEESDHCLSRAVDLLVSLDAIKRKWGK